MMSWIIVIAQLIENYAKFNSHLCLFATSLFLLFNFFLPIYVWYLIVMVNNDFEYI